MCMNIIIVNLFAMYVLYISIQGVRNSSDQILYALYGMVVHSGTLDHGHYIAYVRDGNHGDKATKWYCVNDSHVSSVSIETVLSNQGYILFYELLN